MQEKDIRRFGYIDTSGKVQPSYEPETQSGKVPVRNLEDFQKLINEAYHAGAMEGIEAAAQKVESVKLLPLGLIPTAIRVLKKDKRFNP